MLCECGNDRFYAHQHVLHDVLVNENGNFIQDEGSIDSEEPHGPFMCTQCKKVYDEL